MHTLTLLVPLSIFFVRALNGSGNKSYSTQGLILLNGTVDTVCAAPPHTVTLQIPKLGTLRKLIDHILYDTNFLL